MENKFIHGRYYWLKTGMDNWIIGECWIDSHDHKVFFQVVGLSVLYVPSEFLDFAIIKPKKDDHGLCVCR